MYPIRKALRRYRRLIKFTARKYSVRGHFRLAAEEIEAEGYLTLVRCCRYYGKRERRRGILFGWYFKRAWNNQLIKLRRFDLQLKRQGFEVDLEHADDIPVPSSEVWERIKSKADDLMPRLSAESRQFLRELLEPSGEVMEFAYKDFCRRRRLHVQGVKTSGWNSFRIELRHIRGALDMSPSEMQKAIAEIKTVNQTTWRR